MRLFGRAGRARAETKIERRAVERIDAFEDMMFNRIKKLDPKQRAEALGKMIRNCDALEEEYWRYPDVQRRIDHLRAKTVTELGKAR